MSKRLKGGAGAHNYKPAHGIDRSDIDLPSVLEGDITLKTALKKQAMALPASTRKNLIRPDQPSDPVLRFHLRLDE